MASLASLEERVLALETKRFEPSKDVEIVIDASVRRARAAVESKQLYSAVWKWVPSNYYSWSLAERAACLQARSTESLCKSLLLENKKSKDDTDPTNPKFVLVVLQYAATLDAKKLATALRSLRPVKERLSDSDFEFRIAEPEDNARITGYEFNSVTPLGMLETPKIVVAAPIRELKFVWMGGGHVHLKLGMAFADFDKAFVPLVADISTPRVGTETDGDGF